jgi:hypothetical protein
MLFLVHRYSPAQMKKPAHRSSLSRHNSQLILASAIPHSASSRAFRARKLIPRVPNCAALDDCGAPA